MTYLHFSVSNSTDPSHPCSHFCRSQLVIDEELNDHAQHASSQDSSNLIDFGDVHEDSVHKDGVMPTTAWSWPDDTGALNTLHDRNKIVLDKKNMIAAYDHNRHHVGPADYCCHFCNGVWVVTDCTPYLWVIVIHMYRLI